ncbi:tryparedoxin [Leishmania major strain Friedlin]|uniref:Tryparedoxin n=1 Tax=Leishmania major TaxID=5664 RepID=E9ADX3_LEIMA|nr:tryparedoxin [Leishmania major strain Friedlin]CAG9577852.1 tryparedoxin_2_-_putative [Leishmania major strain Friedlin]CBZ12452.1 tryparedoxin [Leishmania major strain Friedlin]|eukprot:XP_003722194.1 tryparedoxin [Leishmania major strain Friedlin]
MSGLTKFFPYSTSFLKGSATDIVLPTLAGKTFFFYFSASWCPPCRGFTPQLVEFYKKHAKSKNFEVMLISWDEEADDFAEYYKKMPWLALPFEDRKGMEFLKNGFKVETIPTLIGVDADTGKIVTTRARNMVERDPEGTEFPWLNVSAK